MITKRAKQKLLIPYESVRDQGLKDWKVAEAYLGLALEDGLDAFLEALRNVAQAHGMAAVARRSGLTRPALYKLLSPNGNPHARSLWKVLAALNLHFELVAEHTKAA
jgi:probable addiction module antidote protein